MYFHRTGRVLDDDAAREARGAPPLGGLASFLKKQVRIALQKRQSNCCMCETRSSTLSLNVTHHINPTLLHLLTHAMRK